jgi:protein-disulfide isomerase
MVVGPVLLLLLLLLLAFTVAVGFGAATRVMVVGLLLLAGAEAEPVELVAAVAAGVLDMIVLADVIVALPVPAVAAGVDDTMVVEVGAAVASVVVVVPSSQSSSAPELSPVLPPEASVLPSSQSSSPAPPVVSVAVDAGAEAVALVSVPFTPPLTPACSKRNVASAGVSQTSALPLVLGTAKQVRFALHGVKTHAPASHCANCEVMQANCPSINRRQRRVR